MSPAQKTNAAAKPVGQLLIVGFDGTEVTPSVAAMLSRMQPAGVILFARNIIHHGPETFLELLWGFIHQECSCSEAVTVASRPAIPAAIR